MEKEKTTWGGQRVGAGRPKTKDGGKTYAFRAESPMAEYIDSQANKTAFIRECIAREMRTEDRVGERFAQLGEAVEASRVKPLNMPFLDIKLVAGFPIPLNSDEMAQNIEVLQMLCPHPDASYLIRVKGRSMIEAGIEDGDILVVDKSVRTPSPRQVAVCELNGEFTVKRVRHDKEGYFLVPANPDFPEIPVTEGDDFCVWGVVTYIIHKPT